MPVDLANYYALNLAQAVAPVVAAAPVTQATPPMYLYEFTKALLPALVTGGIAYLGFRIGFKNTNNSKKTEILYKEQVDAVKLALGTINTYADSIIKYPPDLTGNSSYVKALNTYIDTYIGFRGNEMAILAPKSRHALQRFLKINSEIYELVGIFNRRHSLRSEDLKTDESILGKFQELLTKVKDFKYVVTDVLYRDLEFPNWSPIDKNELDKFDAEYESSKTAS